MLKPTLIIATAAFFTLASARADEASLMAKCLPANPTMNQLEPNEIVRKLYETVSGAAHQQRDWDVLRTFHTTNSIISTTRHNDDGSFSVRIHTVEQFIALNKNLFSDRGFYESELQQKMQIIGHVAHVWSHYATRETIDGTPYAQGVNSFQFIHDGQRWCVLSATWDGDVTRHQGDLGNLFR